MSSGRQDYWYGSYITKSVAINTLTTRFMSEDFPVGSGATLEKIVYTVLTGYIYHVTGFVLTADQPGIMDVSIYFGVDWSIDLFFDSHYAVNFGGGSDFEVEEGKRCYVKITNNEPIEVNFRAVYYGFLEQIS